MRLSRALAYVLIGAFYPVLFVMNLGAEFYAWRRGKTQGPIVPNWKPKKREYPCLTPTVGAAHVSATSTTNAIRPALVPVTRAERTTKENEGVYAETI